MLKNIKLWHVIAVLILAYFIWNWYKNRKNNSVQLPAKDVSATTLEPGSDSKNANTDPTIARQVTKIYGPDQY